MPVSVLALLGLALPLLGGGQGATGEESTGAGQEQLARARGDDGLREEFFVIEELAPAGGDGRPDGDLPPDGVGLVRCRRLELEQGWQLEWDVRFPAEQTRVLHIERWTPAGSKLVWRELRAGSGRTLSAEGSSEDDVLALREWAGRRRTELEVPVPGGGVLPLHLLELVRNGAVVEGRLHAFDPLARSYEPLRVAQFSEDGGQRRVQLVREDGTLAAAWWLEGDRLEAFQWQSGSLRARSIGAAEYRERLREPASAASTEASGT